MLVCKPINWPHCGNYSFPTKPVLNQYLRSVNKVTQIPWNLILAHGIARQVWKHLAIMAPGIRKGHSNSSVFYHIDSEAFQLHLLPSLTYAGINKVKLLHEQYVKWHLEVNEMPLSFSCNNAKHSGGLPGISDDLKYHCRNARVLRALTGFDGPEQHFWGFNPHLLPMGLGPPFQLSSGLHHRSAVCSCVTAVPAPGHWPYRPTCRPPSQPDLRPTQPLRACLEIHRLHLTLVTVTGPDPDPDECSWLDLRPALSVQTCLMIQALSWPQLPSLGLPRSGTTGQALPCCYCSPPGSFSHREQLVFSAPWQEIWNTKDGQQEAQE